MFPRYAFETVDGIDRRARHRYPVTTPVRLTMIASGQEFSALIEDISLSGVRVRFDGARTAASIIELTHPMAGRFRSHCRWTSGNISGLSFDQAEAGVQLCVHCLKQMVPLRRPA